jgi:hypothetical protein
MVMSLRDDGNVITVSWHDGELFRYVYHPSDPQLESPRPYFHPVRTLGGDLVTVYRPHDHVWHKGIALSLPNVGPENFWGGVTFRRGAYAQLPNNGAMRHQAFDLATVKDEVALLEETLTWVTEAGQSFFAEHRTITATAWPDEEAWVLGFETTMSNVCGRPVSIGSPTTEGRENAGYGGLFWRGPRSFTGGRVLTPGHRDGGDEVMGWRGPWLGFAGRHDGHGRWSTVVFRDSPDNFSVPSQWFVRSTPFACVCPAPFFAEEYLLADGASLTLGYQVAVADGGLDADGCARLAGLAGGAWS